MTDQTPAPLTNQQLTDMAAREAAATPGPWCTDSWEIYQGTEYEPGISEWIGETCRGRIEGLAQDKADAAFVAAARTDVPALLAEIRRLKDGTEPRRLEDGSTHTIQALTDAGESCVQHACTAAREEDRLRQEQYTLRAAVEGVLDEVRYMADDELIGGEQAARLTRMLRDALGLDKPFAAVAGEAGR
ncbi:hypothetical protein SUDANB145_07276 (plasmid) [Streptomyces sp. enrichment culture]|uniref:hypothetical protein n=1 Tax=Streptomyces sp. enrichment culture TaxID=1795815 RepID=UPI003F567300